MVINEPWYRKLEAKYGFEFCVEAGYFDEDRPWMFDYHHSIELPKNTTIIQFSGAFYPFHNGHMTIVMQAVDTIIERTNVTEGVIIIHVDHGRYRWSKGEYDESLFKQALSNLECYKGFTFKVLFEDDIFLSCSRNFTRLYRELVENNNDVYFLSGGDRANFSLSFIDEGRCIVAGRDINSRYSQYKHLENDRIWFLEGNDPTSSTRIRSDK